VYKDSVFVKIWLKDNRSLTRYWEYLQKSKQ